MNKVLQAAGIQVEGYYPGLFVKALKGHDIDKLLSNVGTGAPAAAGPAASAGPAAKADEPAKKEEPKKEEEADVDMGDLFGGGDY